MIDDFSLFATTAMVVFVAWRAATLDKLMPWFGKDRKDSSEAPRPIPASDWRTRAAAVAPRAAAKERLERSWRRSG